MTTIKENNEMDIKIIRNGIREWDNLIQRTIRTKDIKQMIHYLIEGYCFEVNDSDFQHWKKINPKSIHAYLAIFEGKLNFVLIDSTSDKLIQTNTDNIVVKEFTNQYLPQKKSLNRTNPDEISTECAERRQNKWNSHHNEWLEAIINSEKKDIVQAISIPFQDYTGVAEKLYPTSFSAINFFGLTNEEPTNIEIIISNTLSTNQNKLSYFDVSRPVPPFGSKDDKSEVIYREDFKLLPDEL